MPSTPPPQSSPDPAASHQPSSLPTSPLHKRLKTMAEPSAATPGDAPPVTTISQSPPLLIKRLSPSATAPTRGSAFAAGYDIYAAKATIVPKRGKVLVDTDIAIAVPEGTCKASSSFRRSFGDPGT